MACRFSALENLRARILNYIILVLLFVGFFLCRNPGPLLRIFLWISVSLGKIFVHFPTKPALFYYNLTLKRKII